MHKPLTTIPLSDIILDEGIYPRQRIILLNVYLIYDTKDGSVAGPETTKIIRLV